MNDEDGFLLKRYDRFLADSMHTLKNMIAPISAYVEMLQSGLVGEQKAGEINEKIGLCADTATQFCTSLMNVFRVRGGLTDFRAEKINPHDILQEYIIMIEGNLQVKRITDISCINCRF